MGEMTGIGIGKTLMVWGSAWGRALSEEGNIGPDFGGLSRGGTGRLIPGAVGRCNSWRDEEESACARVE